MDLFDRIGTLVTGRDDRQWAGSAEDLLYEGESIRETVTLGAGRAVVTTHRLLAFTPEADGENFRDVDLPNVAGVSADADGDVDSLVRGIKTLGLALVFLIVGQVVDFGGLVGTTSIDTGGAGGVGIGGLLGTLNRFLALFARLDEFMTMFGALLVVLAMVILAAYLLTRQRVLRVDVAGESDDVLIDAPDDDLDRAVARLEAALYGDPSGARESDAGGPNDAAADGTGAGGDPLSGGTDTSRR